jgi:hypothetical protein
MDTTTDGDVDTKTEVASTEVSPVSGNEETREADMAKTENDGYKESIAETLQRFCARKGWTIVDLQNACGLPYPTAYAYYKGYMVPTLQNFRKLQKVLKGDMQPFLDVVDGKVPPPTSIRSKRRKTTPSKR